MHKDVTLCAGRTVAQAQQASGMPVNQESDVAIDQLLVFMRA